MQSAFIVLSSAGKNRDLSIPTREQPFWDQHATFIDGLIEQGVIMMGGPLPDEGGAILIVKVTDEEEIRTILADDIW